MGDLTTELGVEWTRCESETSVPRALIPIFARAARLPRPYDSVCVDVNDDAGLRASVRRSKHLGYAGKSAIHPRQIATIKEVFDPSVYFDSGKRIP
jgi:citrate lyase beta subunit